MVSFSPLLFLLFSSQVQAFSPSRSIAANSVGTTTSLSSSPIPTGNRPPPRRTLKKRKNKRRQRMDQSSQQIRGFNTNDITHNQHSKKTWGEDEEDDVEIRPVRRRDAIEAGLDYWIDEGDLERERQRKISVKNRKSMVGAISQEKLRGEVVAPYKQNWIGLFSVFIVILSAIGTKFPELLQGPLIPIPDL